MKEIHLKLQYFHFGCRFFRFLSFCFEHNIWRWAVSWTWKLKTFFFLSEVHSAKKVLMETNQQISDTNTHTDKRTYTKQCKHWENIYPLDLTQTHTNKEPSVQIKQISLDVSFPLSSPPRDVKQGGGHILGLKHSSHDHTHFLPEVCQVPAGSCFFSTTRKG